MSSKNKIESRSPAVKSLPLLILFGLIVCSVATCLKNDSHPKDGPEGPGRPWFEEDVKWITLPEESAAWKQLKNDEEREGFIHSFWFRRDPTPDTIVNEFEQEHYRRIVYSNQHFSHLNIPGWDTDRGHAYISFGPPDTISEREDAGLQTEIWKYRYIEGTAEGQGFDVQLTFQTRESGGLLRIVGEFPRFKRLREETNIRGDMVKLYIGGTKTPQPRSKDLYEVVVHKIRYGQLPLEVGTEFQKATHATTVANLKITIHRADVGLKEDGFHKTGLIYIYGQVISISGRVEQEIDDVMRVFELNPTDAVFSEANLFLRPGIYQVWLAVLDVNGSKLGTKFLILQVPGFDKLESAHSLQSDRDPSAKRRPQDDNRSE